MEEADGDRVDLELAQPACELTHLGVVERLQHGAVGRHALGELEAQPPLDERRWLAPEEVVHVRDPQAPKLEHVPEALRRDERGLGAEALEHGVRGDGRAVHDLARRRAGGRRRRAPRRPRRPPGRSSAASRVACAPAPARRRAWRSTSVKVPPTSTPIRAGTALTQRRSFAI